MDDIELIYKAYSQSFDNPLSIEEFSSNLQSAGEFANEVLSTVYNWNDETRNAVDRVLNGTTSQTQPKEEETILQAEVVPLEQEEKPKEITINEKLTELFPVDLFDPEGLDEKENAAALSRYLNKVSPSLNVDYKLNFPSQFTVNGVDIDLKKDPLEQQNKLVNTLINLDQDLDLEELEANIAKDDAEFKSLTSYDKPGKVEFNIGEYKYKGNTKLPFVLDDKTQNEIDKKLGTQYRFNIVTNKNEPYNDLSIFEKVEVEKYVGSGLTDIDGRPISGGRRIKSEEYKFEKAEEYLEQAESALLATRKKDKISDPITEDEIKQEALKIYEKDLILDAKKDRFEKYIEGDIEGITGLSKEQKQDLKLKANKKVGQDAAKIERKNDLLEDYLQQIKEFKKPENSEYVSKLNEFKNNSSIVYNIKPGEKFYQFEDGRKIPAFLYDAAKAENSKIVNLGENAKSLIEEINKDAKTLSNEKEKFNIIRKNYNDASKFGVMLGLATTDLVTSTLYGAYKISQYLNPVSLAMKVTSDALGFDDPVDQGMIALKSWEEEVKDEYKDDIAFDDISSLEDVGQYTYQSVANQAPIIVSMIATGGLSGVAAKSAGLTGKAVQTVANVSSSSMIGLSSFGGKMSDMDYEEFVTGQDLYSDAEVLMKSLGYGISEGAFAYFSTAPLLNKGVGKIAGVTDDLVEKKLSEGFRQELSRHIRKDVMPETLGEMFFEGLTTGTQNLIDGRPFMENMNETIVSSGFWGLGMSGIPSLYVAGTKNFTANKELNIINENTSLANQLRRKNQALVQSINDGVVDDVKTIQAEIETNISLIETYEAKAVDAYSTVEENIREKGMLPEDATNFIEGQTNLYKIREEAYNVANDKTKSKAQIEQELETIGEVYNQAAKGMQRFNSTETFGSGYGALMMNAAGKDKNDVVRKKYTKVTSQAIQNLFDKNRNSSNPKDNYNPTGSEIANEADNILFEEQMDKQLDKDRRQSEKLGHTFIDFESREQAIREITNTYDIAIELETNPESKASLEANKKETIERINKGSLNGGSISGAGFELDFVVRENMTRNKRFTTGLHENTHTISRKLLKNNPEAFKNLGDQILKYLVYTNQTDALKAMGASNANLVLDGEYDYDEVISSFVELIAEDKVDLNKMDNFKAAIGKLFNEGLMNASDGDYNIEFKGQKDILEFFLGFGKKIAAGEVDVATLTEAQDRFSIVDKQGKVIPISDTRTQNKIAASKVQASETAKFSKEDQDLFTRVNDIYKSDKSIKNKGFEIGNLYRNFVTSRLNKGFEVGKLKIRPRDLDGFNDTILEDVVSDMATGGSGVPGLVRAYANRDMKRFGSITLPQWINARLNQRILGYLPNDLIRDEISIDTETAKQIEDVKRAKIDEIIDTEQKEDKGRDLRSFEELSIVTPELFDEVRDIVSRRLKKLAITEGVTAETVTKDLDEAITKEITKVIKAEMGPITRSVLGFAPKQYVDFINANRETIIGAMPIDLIKQKAKSKAWSNIFKLKEIGREDIKKTVDGKTTYYRKQIFEVQKPDPQEFAKYFTRAGYTTLIERQRSLIKPIAQELAKTELFKLSTDPDFIADLSDRTGMTSNEVTSFYIDNVMDNMQDVLDQTAGEQRSQDVVKFSESLNDDQRAEFGANADLFVKNFKDLGVNPTIRSVYNALVKTVYNNPNNVNFKGDKGLKTLLKFASEINQPLKRFLAKENKLLDVNTSEFLFQGITLNSSRTDLKRIFSIPESFAKLFEKGSKGQEKQRELSTGFTNSYYENNLKQGLNTFDAALDTIITSLKWMKGHQATAGKSGRYKRLQTYDGTQDFVDNNLSTIPGVEKINGEISVDKNGKETFVITDLIIEGVRVSANQLNTTSPSQSTSKTKAKFESEYDMRQKEADEAWNLMMEYLTYVKNNGTELDFAMTMMSLKSGMDSILKAAAPAEYYYVGPQMKANELRYEHVIPTEYMALALTEYFYGDSDIDINELKSKYKVAVIPKIMDENFNIQLQQTMPPNWTTSMPELIRYYNDVNMGMENMYPVEVLGGKDKGKIIGQEWSNLDKKVEEAKPKNKQLVKKSEVVLTDGNTNYEFVSLAEQLDQALKIARDPNTKEKKIRIFDFDDTIAQSKSDVLFTMPDGTKGRLNAAEFAEKGVALTEQGAKFDFSEFNKVKQGIKGPLFKVAKTIFDKKGSQDLFILTARPMAAAMEIKTFLDSLGIDIPLENVITLENSSPLAKSQWILNKAGEGYNDFYFADDAYKNIEAVQKVLDVADVKSKIQQAKIKFSETVDQAMNDIIYQKTGIESFKEYSDVRAQAEGRGKRSFDLIPPSAEDFGGLLYAMLGKGKIGDAQWEWMQDNLIKPYNRGINDLVVAQNTLAADFKALKQSLEGIPKNLKKKAIGGFTFEDVTRIIAWDKQGIEVDGLSKRDLKDIREFANENNEINVFADQLIALTKQDGYYYPGVNWLAGTITTDFREGLRTTSRSRFLSQWQGNVDEAFSIKNLNKIEAAFGSKYREALEDSLLRMKTGTNRSSKIGRLESQFLDYVNGSVGAVMFLNARSAVLQTISSLNFINWGDNNVFAAGKAFANQPQYWKDFMTLMNSDYLVDRRNGLKINVSENEIAEAAKTSKNKAKAVIATLLSKGFVLTQFADSFAIASGGATFYRNRIKKLMKEGMSESEATKQAFQDFKEVSETSQQSSDPSKISMQQASTVGKLTLAWGNTPMQYNRIIKKASLDLVNNRGDWKDNISKIVYYGALQNIIFTVLQTGLFKMLFSDDEEEDGVLEEKGISTVNSLIDNLLRGMGIGGAIASTVKNLGVEIYDRSKRSRPEYADVALKLLDIAPPIDVKVSKFRQGLTTYEYSLKDPRREEYFNIQNPSYSAAAKVVAATTNVPVDRLLQKAENLKGAMNDQNEYWKRAAMFLGWPEWQLRSTKEASEFKDLMKQRRKQYKESKKRVSAFKEPEAPKLTPRAQDSITYFKLNKPEQVRKLDSLGLTKKEIRALRYEKDRVNKLLELMKQ